MSNELDLVREAILEFSRKNNVTLISGSDIDANISTKESLSFPGKYDKNRPELEKIVKSLGKWGALSDLSTSKLGKAFSEDSELASKLEKFTEKKESSTVTLRKKK